jgi:hypothetical protein
LSQRYDKLKLIGHFSCISWIAFLVLLERAE